MSDFWACETVIFATTERDYGTRPRMVKKMKRKKLSAAIKPIKARQQVVAKWTLTTD